MQEVGIKNSSTDSVKTGSGPEYQIYIPLGWAPPLVRVMYSGLTEISFRLDRVKSSSCDCPAKIPVDSNASCFTCFSSGNSSPEVAEFCPTLRLVYLTAQAYASTCALSSIYSLSCNNFVQKVVPKVKKLFVAAIKDLYLSRVLFRKK
jgi:hypothetical protein